MLPLLYILSFGPACWLADRGNTSIELTASFYRPLIAATRDGPDQIRGAMLDYVRLFMLRRPIKIKEVAGPPGDIISKLYPCTYADLERESVK